MAVEDRREEILQTEEVIQQLGEEVVRLSHTNAATIESKQKLDEAFSLLAPLVDYLTKTAENVRTEGDLLIVSVNQARDALREARSALTGSVERLLLSVSKVDSIKGALNTIHRRIIASEAKVTALAESVKLLASANEARERAVITRLDRLAKGTESSQVQTLENRLDRIAEAVESIQKQMSERSAKGFFQRLFP